MSTTADIVDGITRLIDALDELLESKTVAAIVRLVRKCGIGAPVKVVLDGMDKALDFIITWIAKLEQVAAIPDLLDKLDPALDGLKALGEKSEQEMRDMGLEPLAPLAGAAHAAHQLLEKIRAGVTVVLQGYLPKQSLASLREAVIDLKDTLKDLAQALVAPSTESFTALPSGPPQLVGGGA
ncbi:hypothetical protein SAMN05443572_103363 [Myxococcus fulvus]|uniref:Uncharacterized protein n=1 Tax=Myxococcus fulvus TaxID=33 RepID=A0A511T8V7_MYXFU|nr:hypothetical protein [Myxococcus fulvus]GEN10467.1 hypothetical protein MFU01_55040 [Myxococcus fulvus]SET81951.1 hypothetical protein SAMN05443572_103363 [Myxococcus fulvus]